MARNALSAIADILRGLGIRWALMGALAANRYRSSPRLTQDVDVLLADLGASLETLEEAFRAAGWTIRRATPDGELLRLRHPELGVADLLVAGTEYQQEALRRAREEPLGPGGAAVAVLAPEDVIVHKLVAGRAQDLADIEAMLAAHVALDEAYLESWLEFWEVADRWRSLRR